MPLNADISTALHLLEHIHERVEDCDDPKLQMHTSQDLKSLISLLEDPVFRSIITIQDSLHELNNQLGQHPSILSGDFDINISGLLELSVPNTTQPLGQGMFQDLYQDSSELDDQRVPVAPLIHSSSEDTSAQVTSPSLVSEVMGMPPITTPTYVKEFKKVIEAAAKGRQICTVQLYKPEGTSLGFSVVGLRSKDRGELGIFLQEIQANGIAGCDGRLLEGDQILAIDGQPLDSNISHEQAISILQKARGLVELVVARSTQDVGSSLLTDELSGASSSTTAAAGAAASIVVGGIGVNDNNNGGGVGGVGGVVVSGGGVVVVGGAGVVATSANNNNVIGNINVNNNICGSAVGAGSTSNSSVIAANNNNANLNNNVNINNLINNNTNNNNNNNNSGSQVVEAKEQSVPTSGVVTPTATPKSSQPASTASAGTPTPTLTPTPTSTPVPSGGLVIERSPSAVSDASKSGSDMVLNTEWAQVEVINLINDGSGLGFGIIGGRSTGVVVKTILPGGVADRDNRLQSGDHILQIGDVNLRGMGSEQVAAVLRQSGTHVRLVVARPVEPTSPDYQALGSHAPIVPTKILGDPDELDRHLVHSMPETYNMRHVQGDSSYDNRYMYSQGIDIEIHARPSLIMDVVRNPMPIGPVPVIPVVPVPVKIPELPVLSMDTIDVNSLPEMERFTVELKKDIYGLGITIAGYVCEKEELSGIFVKSISEGSAADSSNKIQINDRIVEVDGHSLQGYSNHEAVEVLRSTGQTVLLCLERYLRGPKYEQLQQAIAASESRLPQPSSPSITSLPSFPISADGETTTEIEPEGESHTTVDSAILQEGDRENVEDDFDEATNVEALLSDPSSELTAQIRAAIKSKWQKIVGPDTEIVVAQLKKFAEGSGLGISLEGTVDVENGQEVRPHHYIRSILPEGPVGQNGTLRSGDELLEVNGYRLLGINHMEVVSVLKELPIHVRMVCGRNVASQDPLCPIDTAQHQAAFQTRSILGGSLQNLLPTMDRLVKAKSDGSLASTTTTATVTDASLNKMKSRSLEPLTGLAMWSSEPQIIELIKGERGLGFSILDYQDPMNPNETVIVIRSLVPGGVAQVDGQLIPGDRLLFVNDIALENATLDQAVQALKGAPKGTVRIGVAKPLPIPDSIVQVSPLCTVRRSRSFPNGSETTDRAAEIEDFLSSRSGVTDLSMDKQEQAKITRQEKDEDRKKKRKKEKEKKKKKKKENAGKRGEEKNEKEDGENYDDDEDEEDDEEEDNWKDASPITPISSPTRKSSRVERQEDKKVSTTKVQEEPKSLVPSSDETKITSSIGDQNGVAAASGTPELAEAPTTGELVAPRVKLKETTRENTVAKDSATESGGSQRRDRRKALTRHGSLDSKAQETSEKSEASLSEKGAKKKVLKDRDETGSKRRAGRKGVEAKSSDRERRSRFGRSSESIELMELGRGSDEVAKRSREERKSLKEQECIERVTQFLSKHSDFSMASPYQPEYSIFEEEKLYEQEGASIGSRPARLELEGAAMAEVTSPSGENAASRRKRDSSELESSRRSEAESPDSSYHRAVESFHKDGGSRWVSERIGEKSVALASTGQTPTSPGGSEPPKRPSSLRKKKDAFSRESSRESLLDDAKKEVRIQEDVEEIFFEDASEQLSVYLPEVQLVKARIITADEALARLTCDDRQQDRAAGVAPEVRPPPEVATVPEHPSPSRERGISEASAKTTLVQLRPLVTLTKAISENALVDKSGSLLLDDSGKAADTNDVVDGGEEENRVSERNIKPEILLDLSKVMEASAVDVVKERKPLARTGSEGSKKRGSFSGAKSRLTTADRRGVIVGSLALPSQPELTNVGGSESDSERKAFFAYADRSAVVVAERISSETPVKEPAKEVSPAAPKFRTEEKEEDKKEESEQKREEERQDREDQQDPQRRKKTKKELGRRDEDESGVGEEAEAKEQEGKSKDFLRQQVRASLLGEEQEVDDVLVVVGEAVVNGRAARQREEDGLISKEHSLEYQSQTLESQQPERSTQQQLQHYQDFPSRSFFGSYSDGWSHEALLEGSLERSFKETQYSPREKCNAETQTEQETKSTQCSPDQSGDVVVVVGGGDTAESFESPYEAVADPSIHRRYRYRSPRKEVQTQTQGENKSVQCSLEDLVALRRGSCWQQEQQQLQRQRQHFVGLNVDSVSVLEQIHESKSVQCVPEDISSRIQGDSERHSRDVVQPSRRHRREVEVQTYQESKAIQCFDEELPPLEETTDRFREIPGARRVVLASIELDERPVAETRVSWKTEGSSASSTSLGSSGSPARVKHLSTVPLVSADAAMTVTHRDYDGNVAWSKHWGPERLVEIYREPKTSLGLSIVGGKVDLHNGSGSKSQNISGIFIKNVVPNSPAARTGELKIGDRIIEVDGVDLRNSTHERAVEVIQASGNPVCLLVQSLVHLSADNDAQDGDERTGRTRSRLPVSGVAPGTPTASFRHKPAPVSPARSITPEVIQGGIQDGEKFPSKSDLRGQSPKISDGAGPSSRRSSMKKSVRRKAPSPPSTRGGLQDVREERENHAAQSESTSRRKYSSEESSEEEDVRLLEGNVYTKAGMEISRKSAGNVKRSKAEIEADSEQEDEFGYTTKKIQKKYHNLGHTVLMVKVEKERRGLGISLAGHRDRNRMAVFICGLNPKGAAHKVGGLLVGDEILEVNGMVFQGRCHLNASALIKGMAGMCFKIIVVRREAAVENIAVKPIVQFPPTLDEMDQFSNYKGVRNVPVKKGQYGLGIMIIEGKHAEVGQGIFVSDIQEGSAAEQAGLLVGDMILAVNMDYLLGSTYDEATSLLKKAEGVVTLTVCNPNQSKIGKEEEEKAKAKEKDGGKSEAGTSGAAVTAAAPKEPEKPKEPEPPQDPKECKITAGRETTIEFQKDKDKGIGFTIAGGSDTPMNGVFILEVFPDGAAGKDGRLQAGDQIIQMCQENFKSIEHEKAHGTVLKVTGTINMIVFRDEKPPEEVEVELQKKSGKGAGLCLTGFKSGKGAYVSDLLPGGSALESGKICKGDRVVAICGQDVREASVEDIAVHIKVSNPVQLKLARYQSAKQ